MIGNDNDKKYETKMIENSVKSTLGVYIDSKKAKLYEVKKCKIC